ncbi:ATP-dependent helicase [Anaerocolumna aminovalerica]|uniref:ATP-dependent helicase n=1 Tax=Anaerocolumna aminovalerica TaxID=1527 RepID=UPI001596E331|nr:ATP-dependent helicase [Anaerocolumna aminovalerica]
MDNSKDKKKVCEILCGKKECPEDISKCDGKKIYKCKERKKSFIRNLNSKQLEYITSDINKNIYLNACPGSGKTEVLAIKCAYEQLLWNKKTQGYAVLTFTNSAEDEIRDRVESFMGERIQYPHYVGTFTSWIHGYIANPFLSKITLYRGNKDKDKSLKLIESSSNSDFFSIYSSKYGYVELGNIKAYEFFKDFKSDKFIYCGSRSREGNKILNQLIENDGWRYSDLNKLKLKFWKDGFYLYEDIEYLVYLLLSKNEEITSLLAKRFPLVLIDECQDLSYVQLEIIRLLMNKGSQIHLIGDLNQAIYGFRNIEPSDTLEFINELKFEELILNQNYRSCQKIVDICERIINRNSSILGCNEYKIQEPLVVFLYKKDKELDVINKFYDVVKKNNLELDNSRIIVRNNSLINKLIGIKNQVQSSNNLEDIATAVYLFIKCNDISDFKSGFLLLAKSIQKIYFKDEEHLNRNFYYKPTDIEMNEWRKLLAVVYNILKLNLKIEDYSKTWTEWKKILKEVMEKQISNLPILSEKHLNLGSIRSGYANKTLNKTLFLNNQNTCKLRTETIHGCKGMSLDAVLLFSTYQTSNSSDSGSYWRQWFDKTLIDEKNRLAYVAFSRAKYLLALAIPKTNTFSDIDMELLRNHGFKIIDEAN